MTNICKNLETWRDQRLGHGHVSDREDEANAWASWTTWTKRITEHSHRRLSSNGSRECAQLYTANGRRVFVEGSGRRAKLGAEPDRRWIRLHQDYLIADIPGPDQATMDAIVLEAHKHQKRVVTYAASYAPFTMALNAGVDVITHLPLDKAVDLNMANRMLVGKMISVPMLCMMHETTEKLPLSSMAPLLLKPTVVLAIVRNSRNGIGKQTYVNARESTTALHQAGVPILAGTDCYEEPNSPFDVEHGVSMHRALDYW
ncbi:hypothetical protein BAUCODRAFT_147966 [Baudoinia panamericana UAMH 10762]|uniref:Amidohydrolase-related domain-containing protein n=1 Tax=Baudoinia panamericana (strain UAMH 10762) TaxID=717646 RepID=M2NB11_BAUPA|nr:uncharacterized protein BAUCODRAFT_147966 [Baudoinia panamericana UAMH 10762]EMC96339.1 hypothetical protein BAUCODRAFT_147966 [Baudoinia panamericana UAMH 10762]